MTEHFYTALDPVRDLHEMVYPHCYQPVPDDWLIVVSDIVNSTAAVEVGAYQAVNFVGAACIAAVLNIAGEVEVPFLFGGDGATMAIPPSLSAVVQSALQGVQQCALSAHSLTLRAAVIPVQVLRQRGADLHVAKLQMSPHYAQALFRGGGARLAEQILKDAPGPYHLVPDSEAHAIDLSGLECRWKEVAVVEREVVTVLISPCPTPAQQTGEAALLRAIATIYDLSKPPIPASSLRLTLAPRRLGVEARMKAAAQAQGRWQTQLRLWALNVLGRGLLGLKLRTAETDWGQYPALVQANLDYCKYEDGLRLVLVGTPDQRHRLEQYLEAAYEQGLLMYGTHTSDRAVLTCLVFERMGRQVHFVDGAEGGYTHAAQQLKARAQLQRVALG